MEFRITGRIIPYVRMTQRSKFTDPDAIAYLASQEAIRWQLKQQMAEHGWEMLPKGVPLFVSVLFAVTSRLHGDDLDNKKKAVLDAMQSLVYKNDCWVDGGDENRELVRGLREDVTTLVVRPL